MHVHLKNWKREGDYTACSLKNREMTRDISALTCEVCILRLLREGQKHGLRAIDIMEWDLDELERMDE